MPMMTAESIGMRDVEPPSGRLGVAVLAFATQHCLPRRALAVSNVAEAATQSVGKLCSPSREAVQPLAVSCAAPADVSAFSVRADDASACSFVALPQ